jgi:hypothetical protein
MLAGEWRKLHNEELKDLYLSSDIFRVKTSRRLRWEGHIVRMRGEERCIQGIGGETRGKETTWETQA